MRSVGGASDWDGVGEGVTVGGAEGEEEILDTVRFGKGHWGSKGSESSARAETLIGTQSDTYH